MYNTALAMADSYRFATDEEAERMRKAGESSKEKRTPKTTKDLKEIMKRTGESSVEKRKGNKGQGQKK